MTKGKRKEILDNVQPQLRKLQGEVNIDIIFLSSQDNRGVIGGSAKGLACLLAFSMVKFDLFRNIIKFAERLVDEHSEELQEIVKNNIPTREIVNYFNNDFEKLFATR